jgi:hypothetical protein
MLKLFYVLTFALLSAAPGGAQPPAGNEVSAKTAAGVGEAAPRLTGEDLFARAFVLDHSTTALYAVFESTNPGHTAASYLRRGVYRREFLVLFSIARDSRTAFKVLVEEREKGGTLQAIAKKYKADLMKLFRESEALQKEVEAGAAKLETAAASAAPGISSAPVRQAVPGAAVKPSTSTNERN